MDKYVTKHDNHPKNQEPENNLASVTSVVSGGTKYDDGKLRFDLIPASAEIALAEALTHGAKKYAADNWRLGFPWTRTYAATRRHLNQWIDPRQSDIDADSGLNHLKLAFCNLAFLIEFLESKPELDDRIKL